MIEHASDGAKLIKRRNEKHEKLSPAKEKDHTIIVCDKMIIQRVTSSSWKLKTDQKDRGNYKHCMI